MIISNAYVLEALNTVLGAHIQRALKIQNSNKNILSAFSLNKILIEQNVSWKKPDLKLEHNLCKNIN